MQKRLGCILPVAGEIVFDSVVEAHESLDHQGLRVHQFKRSGNLRNCESRDRVHKVFLGPDAHLQLPGHSVWARVSTHACEHTCGTRHPLKAGSHLMSPTWPDSIAVNERAPIMRAWMSLAPRARRKPLHLSDPCNTITRPGDDKKSGHRRIPRPEEASFARTGPISNPLEVTHGSFNSSARSTSQGRM